MGYKHTIIIGGGQAGLAMSRCLISARIDHLVLERGRIGERWRSERWDSSTLITPNWFSRLPYFHYRGDDPDGFMTMPEVAGYFENYAESFKAPVQTGTEVLSVARTRDGRFVVVTDRGTRYARNVVVATGFCDIPRVPEFATKLDDDIDQIVPTKYRNPGQLAAGGVLVVGASASGAQIAEELAAAGRQVTLAVGTHVRLPREYRGRDILWWMEMSGGFMAGADPAEERKTPPPQLTGGASPRDLDLATLQAAGVRLTGRVLDTNGTGVQLGDDLKANVAKADAALEELLDNFDNVAGQLDLDEKIVSPSRPEPVRVAVPPRSIDLRAEGIRTVIWATGFKRAYPWLKIPVLDEQGEIRQFGGVTPVPGLYTLGIRFMRRKNSNFIDGVGNDAQELARHLVARDRVSAA